MKCSRVSGGTRLCYVKLWIRQALSSPTTWVATCGQGLRTANGVSRPTCATSLGSSAGHGHIFVNIYVTSNLVVEADEALRIITRLFPFSRRATLGSPAFPTSVDAEGGGKRDRDRPGTIPDESTSKKSTKPKTRTVAMVSN